MKILYAPTYREQNDALHANCLCGYDIQILETLCDALKSQKISRNEGGGNRLLENNVFYLPHPKTPSNYSKVITQSLKGYPLKTIKTLSQAKNANTLVTDVSKLSLVFSMLTKQPSIIFLPSLNINFGEDRFSQFLLNCCFFANSLETLEHIILAYPQLALEKQANIEKFLEEDLL